LKADLLFSALRKIESERGQAKGVGPVILLFSAIFAPGNFFNSRAGSDMEPLLDEIKGRFPSWLEGVDSSNRIRYVLDVE